MATYVNDLRLKEIGTGESSGTWGTETNTNLELIGEALGYATEGITTNADTHATTVADGSTDPSRAMDINYTATLDSACTITIGPNTMSRVHMIENATSGSQNIIISQGSGANVTIPNGFVKAVYLDGAGSGAAVTEAFADLSIGPNLRIGNAAAEDTSVVFDGNAKDFYIGLDDSADKLVIGEGSTVGTNNILTITDDTVTIGDGAAVDTAIVFDGNAQDFYIGLDDSTDDLVFGKGSTLGTTQAMAIDENMDVAFGPTTNVTITNDGNEDTLQLVSTDTDANAGPVLDFNRPVTGADDDVIGKITFSALDDGNNAVDYAYIATNIKDASDAAEDGLLDFQVMSAGTSRSFLILNGGGTVIVNQDSQDIDFRVESANDTHALFVNAGSDVVSFGGMQSDSRYFSGLIPKLQADALTRMDASIGLTCNSNDTLSPMIMFGKTRGAALNGTTVAAAGDAIGSIVFNPSDGTANLNAMGHTAAAIDAAVGTGIGTNDVPAVLRFYTNAGGESATERMRISDVNGFVSMGNTVAETLNTASGYSDLAIGKGSGDNAGMSIYSGTSHGGAIAFADGTSGDTTYRGLFQYSHGDDSLNWWTAATQRLNLNSTNLFPQANDAMDLGGTSNKWDDIYATNGTIITSDRNEKNTIVDSDLGLSFIKELKPVSYKFNNKTRTHYGLIAQDVKETLDSISKSTENFAGYIEADVEVDENANKLNGEGAKWKKTGEKTYGLRYGEFMAPLIKAVQEQQVLIETLQTKVAALEGA